VDAVGWEARNYASSQGKHPLDFVRLGDIRNLAPGVGVIKFCAIQNTFS
jgi:hypothetical protein